MSLNKCQRRCAGGRPQAAPEQECNEEISPEFFVISGAAAYFLSNYSSIGYFR